MPRTPLFPRRLSPGRDSEDQAVEKGNMFRSMMKRIPRGISLQRRGISTGSVVGKRVESAEELDAIFAKSTWSTFDLLIEEANPVEITEDMLDGLLELSGLSKSLSKEERTTIVNSLTEQLSFIRKLHNVDLKCETQDLARLVDDQSVKPLTFESLMENISNTRGALSKGEVENSWNPISLASQHQNRYFLVKEGLLKKNK
ncbi:hypothetical protein PMKS-002442 [Pichia membranifaciens]|uniref:Glutamyl-tRNA(Gln) amidotransferase subunit F, mitochondrial n=1 Tax=Pichia membranifaciens TaxID=4926 RepID=A0A1Q2YHF5_9ASCO|nr:hypothetical protein PMKS-002442 [Pichia membranifaciens]